MKTTIWQPDTCGCEIVYQWDETVPEKDRVHSIVKVNRKCSAHKLHGDAGSHFSALLDENQRKNIAFGEAQKVIPALTPEFFKYEFDEARALKITLVGPSPSEKAQIHAALDSRFGAGKARVE